MTILLAGVPQISADDVEVGAISCALYLDSDETVTGTPTVAEVLTTDLTIENVHVNTAVARIRGRQVAAGKAVLFSVSGQAAGDSYTVLVTFATSGGRTKNVLASFTVAP